MSKRSFKSMPIMLGLLGVFWGILEYTLDIYLLGQKTHLLQRTTMLYHLIMGFFFGYLMMFVYIKSKNTEHKYINELYSSEERYRMIFENSPLGIMHFNRQGIITDSNDKLIEIMGSSRQRIIGFNMLTQVNDAKMKTSLKTAIEGKIGYYDGIYSSETGEKTLSLKAVFSGITSETGEFLGGIGIFEDVTEKKQIETEMARLDRLDLVGQMSAGIGHEIRNPMTTVRGFLQLLGNKETDSKKREYYDVMISELNIVNSIISEFLSLAKNKLIKKKSTSINDILDVLHPLILVDALKQDKQILIEKGPVPRIPLDEKEIRQLILNLVWNGLEAMTEDKDLVIRTFIEGDDLVLSVRDEGSGIRSEVLEKIGTPFFTTKEKGTGLGLAVCYSIAERHNAKIEIKTGSSGTTFNVRFKIPNTLKQVS